MRTVRVGDHILWRGGFGRELPKDAVISGMQLSEIPRDKYGSDVEEVTEDQIRNNLVVFDLKNGHWCYSEQVELYPVGVANV